MAFIALFGAARRAVGRSFRNGFLALIVGVALIEGLGALFNHSNVSSLSDLGSAVTSVSFSVPNLFVHITAILFGVICFALWWLSTAAMSVVKGTLNVADEAVDAVDGPKRHGLF